MIASKIGGNLGNHMWHYSICRVVGETLNLEWGVDMVPIKGSDYFGGMNQMYFMDVDFGKPIENIQNYYFDYDSKTFNDARRFHNYLGQDYWFNSYDSNVFNIKDNTLIQIISQSEDFLINKKSEIINWFRIKDEYKEKYDKIITDYGITLDENTCVINFRGGEYKSVANLILRREYWRDSINHMMSINKDMKFVVITDDPECALSYMPFHIPCIHVDIGFDFYVVNQSKYVIISNSSFGWWAAWLNTNSILTIAPKYWISHNVSNGFWSLKDTYTRCFMHMDREGKLDNYDECKKEAEKFYNENNLN
jgi:hypothetical protein